MTISGTNPDLVFKRMPMFYNTGELGPYLELYEDYLRYLTEAGVEVVPAAITSVIPSRGNIVVYIVQEKRNSSTLVNSAIHSLPDAEIEKLFAAILEGIGHVFAFNDARQGEVALGFDAQMSNWSIIGYDESEARLPDPLNLLYIDTSSPLLRLNGHEQCDPELFLRAAPSFLRWVVRLLFLDDVLTRYYDRRQVIIDVLANLYKEKRVDMIPVLLNVANAFLHGTDIPGAFQPLTQKEIADYYHEDARIWTVYLAFRRLDRRLHLLLGQPYPYILPGPVDR
jgi:hypothetical protein